MKCPFAGKENSYVDCIEKCALYDHENKCCVFHRIGQELIKLNERG